MRSDEKAVFCEPKGGACDTTGTAETGEAPISGPTCEGTAATINVGVLAFSIEGG